MAAPSLSTKRGPRATDRATGAEAGSEEGADVTESRNQSRKPSSPREGATMSAGKAPPSTATASESVYSARLTLKEWLTHLEKAGLLKPGATARILTNQKLKRISLPEVAAR